MVERLTSEPAVLDGDVEFTDGTDLSVEPVEHVASADPDLPRDTVGERIRLQLKVVALEAALARARRRRALVVDQYERALERRERDESPEFSWRA